MKETGVVTTYFQSRHYGFITSDVDDLNRFFHNTNYAGTPKLGTRVEFELADPTRIGKEKQAVNIVPLPQQAQKASGKAGA